MDRKLLTAVAIAPVLALSAFRAADATITATDPNAWTPATVTITAGETVTFQYPSGSSGHNLVWTGKAPPCDGNIPGALVYGTKGWKGTCTFAAPGRYEFSCKIHDGLMDGAVIVEAPAPVPTVTSTPSTSAPPDPATPQASPTPAGLPTPAAAPPPKIRVAAAQRGIRVRGTVDAAPGARVNVTVRRGGRRVGRSTRTGAARFSVPLDARTRKALREAKRLKLTVVVSVTPPRVSRTFTVTLRK